MDFNDLNTVFFVLNSTFIPFNPIWEIMNISKSFHIATCLSENLGSLPYFCGSYANCGASGRGLDVLTAEQIRRVSDDN